MGTKMLLTIRGQNTHLLECTGSENVAELKAKIAVLENLPVGELRLFSVGSPLEDDVVISTQQLLMLLYHFSEVRCTVLSLVPVKSSTRPLKWRSKRRRRRRLVVLSAEFSTTDVSST